MKLVKINRLATFLSVAFLFSCSPKPTPRPDPVTEYYHVTFDAKGGTPTPEPQEVEKDHCVIPPEVNPEKDDAVFKYWREQGKEGAYNFSTPVTHDLVLEAKFNSVYTVTFETFGGDPIPDQTVEEDHCATRPENDPTRADAEFDDWYCASKTGGLIAFNFEETPINSDITLYAKFDNIYFVIFETNGGTSIPPVEVLSGKTISEPDTPRKGISVFAGWYKEKELINIYNFNSAVNSSFVLYAKWDDYWLVDLYAPGANPEHQLKRIKDSECVTSYESPVYPDYEFKGWHYTQIFPIEEEPINLSNTPIYDNLILFASWDKSPYGEVTFKYNDGSTEDLTKEVLIGDYVEQPDDPTVKSNFKGWYLDDELFDFDTPITKNITLHAQYSNERVVLEPSNTLVFENPVYSGDTFTTNIKLNSGVDGTFYYVPKSLPYYEMTTSNGKYVYDRCSLDTNTTPYKLTIDLTNLTSAVHVKAGEAICKYLSFTGVDEGESTLTFDPEILQKSGGALEYSAELTEDKDKWKKWEGGRGTSPGKLHINKGETYYIRGTNEHLGGDEINRFNFVMAGKFKASGDITCLRNFSTTKVNYEGLFNGCDSLITPPQFPLTKLDKDSYLGVFDGCINLIEAPVLPATDLGNCSYMSMFSGCDAIKKMPYLPATNLKEACYKEMFCGCISLTKASPLIAERLESSCYSSMFSGCKALVRAPQICATTMNIFSCDEMFHNCSSLRYVDDLKATELTEQCCMFMFNKCISLEIAPKLPAINLKSQCYSYMFEGCSNLRELSVGFNETAFDNDYTYTFKWFEDAGAKEGVFKWKGTETYDNRGISTIPEGWTIEVEK